jgi:VanZ family protein
MISWFERHSVISWIITAAIAAFIFYASSWTSESIGPPVSSWQPIAYHFVAFFFLCFFLLVSLVQGKLKRNSFIAVAIILSLFYGIYDEFHQLFIQGRSCSFSDFLINSVGIYFATLLYCFRIRFWK